MTELYLTLWVLLLLLLLAGGGLLNLLGLPGNWLILGAMIVHALVTDPLSRVGISWSAVGFLFALALAGEGLEFLAGLLGAGKVGGSRRGIVLAFIGSMVGAGVGFGVGNAVVPVLGGVVGVLLLGSLGALVGAVLGETWKGRSLKDSLEVGRGAFVGRLVGTLSKSFVSAAMLMVSLGALMV